MHRQYNPARHVTSWLGFPFLGVAEGEAITVELDEDQASLVAGAQGDTTAVLNTTRSGTATVRLLPGSPTNDLISAQQPDFENNRLPTGVFMLKDLDGNTVVHAEHAFLMKMSPVAVGKELPVREYTFKLAKVSIFVGGSVEV